MGQCSSAEQQESAGDGDKGAVEISSSNRSCTDFPCCLLFLVFIAGFIIVALWSFAMGDYRRVIYPTNSAGQVCGRDVPDKPYLYFFDLARCFTFAPSVLIVGCSTPQVCVKSCPDYYWSWKSTAPSRELMICLDGVNATDPKFAALSVEQLVQTGNCAPYTFNSKPVFGRCMPSQLSHLVSNDSQLVSDASGKLIPLTDESNKKVSGASVVKGRNVIIQLTNFIEKISADLAKSWPTIVVCLLLAVILSFLWIVMLRCCAGFMVWFTLILFILLFAASTGFCFFRWFRLRKAPEEFPAELVLDFRLYLKSASLWLALGIISAVVFVIFSLVVLFLRSRIRIAIGVISETSKALIHMTSVLFWPLFPLVLDMLILALALFVAVCLRSISDPVGTANNQTGVLGPEDKARQDLKDFFQLIPCDHMSNSSAGKACRFLYYGDRKYVIFLQFFNLFMVFWLINFVRAIADMTLAGAFAEFYYSRRSSHSMSNCPVAQSFRRAVVYHCGSAAFGSLILAVLQWIRVLLEYVETELKRFDNACTKALLRCCCCLFWCLEKCIRFLNRNAFIMVAAHGHNFCSGAKTAFNLLIKNIIRVFIVDKITAFLLLIGKLLVVVTCGSLAYVYLDGILFADTMLADFQPTIHYLVVPVLVVVLGSFIIATLFAGVYEMGVDTIFLCFLEDLDTNNGSIEHPYYMGNQLLSILGKKNQSPPSKKIDTE